MDQAQDVLALTARVSQSLGTLANRVEDLANVDSSQAAAYSQLAQPLLEEGESWQDEAQAWLDTKSSWGRKRPGATALIDRALDLLSRVDSLVLDVTDLVKAPREAMNAVATALSKLAFAEQQVPSLSALGGDTVEIQNLMAQLREYSNTITGLVDAGRSLEAVQVAPHAVQAGTELVEKIRSVASFVETLGEDVERARSQAQEVDTLAKSVVKAVEADCPADPQSLRTVKNALGAYNRAMDLLEAFDSNTVPARATTVVYNALVDLQEAREEMETTLELEITRNYAWRTTMATSEEIAQRLTSAGAAAAHLWPALDEVNAALANGEVFTAVSLQASLVENLTYQLRPALPSVAQGVSEDLSGQEEQTDPVGEEIDSILALPAGKREHSPDLAALRELVRNLASEVHSLRDLD